MPSMPQSLFLAIILLLAFAHISALAAPMPLPSSRATPCPEWTSTTTTTTKTTTVAMMLPTTTTTTTTTTATPLPTHHHTTPHDELKMKRNFKMVDLIHSDGSVTTTLLDFPNMRESRNESGSESGSGMEEKNGSSDRSGKMDMEKESKRRVSVVNGMHGNDTTTTLATHHHILPSFFDENKNETENQNHNKGINANTTLPTHHHAPLPKYNTSSPFQTGFPAVLGSDNDTSTTLPTHHHRFPILPRAGDGMGSDDGANETSTAMLRGKHHLELEPMEVTVTDGGLLIPDIGDRGELERERQGEREGERE